MIHNQSKMVSMLIYSLIFLAAQVTLTVSWSYKEQDKWPLTCRKGVAQSPIDLVTSKTIPVQDEGFVGRDWLRDYNATLQNDGYTIFMTLDNKEPIILHGGGLPGTFDLDHIEFRWNSEHTIDGERKAFETHIILKNIRFSSLKEALKYKNGKAVLSILYKLDGKDNDRLVPIVEQLGKLKDVKSSSKTTINIMKLLPENLGEFYRYWGSKPKPDCEEVDVWTVFTEICKISQAQVNAFASIKGANGETLSENYRRIQPLNGRHVFKYTTGPAQ